MLNRRQIDYQFETGTGVAGRAAGYQLRVGSGLESAPVLTSEQTVVYGYDPVGRFSRLNNTTAGTAFDYAYTDNSALVGSITETASGWRQTRTYEATRDVLDVFETRVGVASKARFDYSVDELGRRKDVAKTGELFARYGASGLSTVWTYNDRSDLLTERMSAGGSTTTLPGRDLTFDYDLIGNRKTATSGDQTLTYTSNAVNQYDRVAGRRAVDVAGLGPTGNVFIDGAAATRQGEYFHRRVTNPTAGTATPKSLWQSTRIGLSAAPATADIVRWFFLPVDPEPLRYDADGNLTSDGRWSYTYDAENRLIRMETLASQIAPTGVIPLEQVRRLEFTYDYLGRRVEKMVRSGFSGGTTYATTERTRFIYNGWNLIADYTATVTTTTTGSATTTTTTLTRQRHYTWGLDLAGPGQRAGGVGGLQLIVEADGTKRLPVYDGNGNVMALVNTNGTFAAVYEYDAYGQTLRANGPAAASNPFRFSTKYTDNESGLVYYGLRYYSPSTGRFINRDPIEEQGGMNLYAFVRNNAVNGWDYLGLDPEIIGMDGGSYSLRDRFDARFQDWRERTHTVPGNYITGIIDYLDAMEDLRRRNAQNYSLESGTGGDSDTEKDSRNSPPGKRSAVPLVENADSGIDLRTPQQRAADESYAREVALGRGVAGQSAFGDMSSGLVRLDPFVVNASRVVEVALFVGGIFVEPLDLALTVREIYKDPRNPWSYAGLFPIIPAGVGKLGKAAENIRPPNLSPSGAGRTGALREALRQNGVPTSQQPSRVLPNVDRRGNPQPGRIYEYDVPAPGGGTRTVRIRDDAGGHNFGPHDPQNRGPHFNDEAGNHYDYP